MKTSEIIARQRRERVHPGDQGGGGMVSSRSEWSAGTWELDVEGGRRRALEGRMTWDADIAPEITEGLKTLAWSLLVDRPGTKPMPIASAAVLSVSLRYLGNWMQRRNHRSFATLGQTAVQVFRDDLVVHLTKGSGSIGDIDIDTNSIARYLRPLSYIEEQARSLEQRGIARIPTAPFGPSSAYEYASELVVHVESFTPPLPDEVTLPIVREAHRWLEAPAEDILRLQGLMIAELGKDRNRSNTYKAVREMLRGFEFTPHVEGEPAWHPPFAKYLDRDAWNPEPGTIGEPAGTDDDAKADDDGDGSNGGGHYERGEDDAETELEARPLHGTDRARRLISNLIAACAIVIRFQTGIRHGELFTFKPGLDPDGMPTCVEREQSVSGAYEMFFVHGILAKGEDEPVATRWLLAGRLYDDPATPDAVRALIILNRLAQPWQSISTDEAVRDALLIQPGNKGVVHDPKLIRPLAQPMLSIMMRDFISDHVDLSGLDGEDERLAEYKRTHGRCVQSRQWRKTWANWMIRVDKRLLPAISQQFHHRSVLLTEEAYIGKDAMQLGLVESAAMTRAVTYIRRAMTGDDHVGGGMRKVVSDGMDELRERLAGLSGEAQDHEVRTWLLDRDIRIWSSPHGKCFIGLSPTDARCHDAAATTDWSNQAPSFANRTPQQCSGCPCFAVDEDDLPFWTERYLENRGIWDDAVGRGMEVNYSVANERWQQSAKVLQSLGYDLATIGREG